MLHFHQVPSRLWVKIGTDLFSCNHLDYPITVDYYSRFWEVDALPHTTSHTVINNLKTNFVQYGILDVCISDGRLEKRETGIGTGIVTGTENGTGIATEMGRETDI